MKKAVCVLTNTVDNIEGYIEFNETENNFLEIIVKVSGLTKGYHGFHIHETGDLRKGCGSLCAHFNPLNTNHGDINDDINNRHIGDLGNIYADSEGNVNLILYDKLIKLEGEYNIIGRSVVIHAEKDDLGIGGLDEQGKIENNDVYEESLKTGNAGIRVACGVIGIAK